jgi:oligopeptide/dipeptide ABC transporter ATP-binding protein
MREQGGASGGATTAVSEDTSLDGQPLAELAGVVKHYRPGGLWARSSATVQAVAGVDLAIEAGTTVGIVGESGCGKSTLGRMLVGLEKPTGGEVRLRGRPVADMRGPERKAARYEIQMMFQDPYAALNPQMSIARIIEEPLRARGGIGRAGRRAQVRRLADDVGLSVAQLGRYPRELSGGQRQRVGLARALATNPALIVADEPVSALDVSVRSQILNLMARLQSEHQLTYFMVSHDLTVIHFFADQIAVMYLGKIVESGSPDDLFRSPAHHYTRALIDSVPQPMPGHARRSQEIIRGDLPSAAAPPSGCRFRTRCPAAQPLCAESEPPLRGFGPGHRAACHFPLTDPAPA